MGLGLPFVLPASSCPLLVAPDVVVPLTTSATGAASLALPIPGQPSLAGQLLFAQWSDQLAGPLQTSDALALHLYP